LSANDPGSHRHFIQQHIDADIASGRWAEPGDRSAVRTRFPPEPNGFLHIGHAKSIVLNFELAREYGGRCVLRFDDTNPAAEEQRYIDAIERDVRWLGYDWEGEPRFASDYFQRMHDLCALLIESGKAYVDEQTSDRIRQTRGTPSVPGTPSPWRDRPPSESLGLFARMTKGEIPEGSMVVRARIDMASPNMNLRDPVLYRILNTPHPRTGNAWSVYPMYDWAHGLEDSIEGITHSLCTLEFENHRPLYDWLIDAVNDALRDRGQAEIHHAQQIEFARLDIGYAVMSKRRLRTLVEQGYVSGWDDPRMITISGLRRRGYTPRSIRRFCRDVGVTKYKALIDMGRLENAIREDLNQMSPRRMAVLDPLRVVIENWAEHGDPDRVEWMDAINNPEDPSAGTRRVPFTGTLYIERDDYREQANRKWFRLAPGREVRLRYGYWITCREAVRDEAGELIELRCTYDPQTRGGESPPPDASGAVRKVKGTLHWVSAAHAVGATVRNYDRLFAVPRPDRAPEDAEEGWTFLDYLNPDSLEIIEGVKLEPAWQADPEAWADGVVRYQFERQGYYCLDPDSNPDSGVLIFNRTATLKDSWTKLDARAANE